jgi:hypothetical protein
LVALLVRTAREVVAEQLPLAQSSDAGWRAVVRALMAQVPGLDRQRLGQHAVWLERLPGRLAGTGLRWRVWQQVSGGEWFGGAQGALEQRWFALARALPDAVHIGHWAVARPMRSLEQVVALGHAAGHCLAQWDVALAYAKEGKVVFRLEDASGNLLGTLAVDGSKAHLDGCPASEVLECEVWGQALQGVREAVGAEHVRVLHCTT